MEENIVEAAAAPVQTSSTTMTKNREKETSDPSSSDDNNNDDGCCGATQLVARVPPPRRRRRCSERIRRKEWIVEFYRYNVFKNFPPGFLDQQLFPFLSINDTTNFGFTCFENNHYVQESRIANNPCIYWEERRPTRIGYGSHFRNVEEIHEHAVEQNVFCVVQCQNFQFSLDDRSLDDDVDVEIELRNEIWDEHKNCRSDASHFPSETIPRIAITQGDERLFIANLPQPYDMGYKTIFVGKIMNIPLTKSLYLHQNKQTTFDGHWSICGCVATALRYSLPKNSRLSIVPVDYLMKKLPNCLHKHFPDDLDDDGDNYDGDRETKVEFEYCPAPSIDAYHC